jgi:fluoride ion exporter CrcB/FEX
LIAFFLSETSGDTQIVLTAGFAGALTTVSTFGMELKQLPRLTAWIYAVVTMISCFIVFNLTTHLF